jgi:steroid delta-isomerase
MLDELTRKELALEYCRRMNAGDLDGVLRLFAQDIRFEDPVGSPPVVGRAALRAHLAAAIAARVSEVPGTPVAARDGRQVAVPVVATLDYLPLGATLAAAGLVTPPTDPGAARLRFSLLSLLTAGPDRLLHEVRVFWGRTDVTVVPGAAAR